jgi:hypothetical protein
MNKVEAAYDAHLKVLRMEGDVIWHGYEAIKLRLADKTYFTPDFAVLKHDGCIEFIDVKGRTTRVDCKGKKQEKAYSQEDARLKVKVAAAMFPMFTFKTAFLSKETGGWVEEEF